MKIQKASVFLMFLGILMGAFGAHALKGRIAPEFMPIYHTGVLYHLVTAAALMGLRPDERGSRVKAGAWLVVCGVMLFSGSLYALACTGIKVLGAVTPLGGLLMMAGWLFVLFDGSSEGRS